MGSNVTLLSFYGMNVTFLSRNTAPMTLDRHAYATAERLLRHNRGELVLGGKVTPRWLDGGARFWYTVNTSEGKRFVVADPGAGTRDTYESQPADGTPPSGNPLEIPAPDGKYAVYRAGH